MNKRIFVAAVLFCIAGFVARSKVVCASEEGAFLIEGVKEIVMEDGKCLLNRHTDGMWQREGINNIAPSRARTQTGIRITFRTDSRTVKPLFELREGTLARGVNNYYGVYLNGTFQKDYPGGGLVLEGPEGVNEWTVVLPIMYGVNFCGVEIDDDARVYDAPAARKKPVYLAIGDSITHGAGLKGCSSVLSYPYVLAEDNGYYLYNTAIGGSQISPGLAYEFADIQADFITVMWGYNDWNALKGDLAEIKRRYSALLENLLETQKTAVIFCILPTVAANEAGKEGYKSDLQGVRDTEKEVVLSFGNDRLVIIDGKSLTSTAGLNGQVHFCNEGSVAFGHRLASYVK